MGSGFGSLAARLVGTLIMLFAVCFGCEYFNKLVDASDRVCFDVAAAVVAAAAAAAAIVTLKAPQWS